LTIQVPRTTRSVLPSKQICLDSAAVEIIDKTGRQITDGGQVILLPTTEDRIGLSHNLEVSSRRKDGLRELELMALEWQFAILRVLSLVPDTNPELLECFAEQIFAPVAILIDAIQHFRDRVYRDRDSRTKSHDSLLARLVLLLWVKSHYSLEQLTTRSPIASFQGTEQSKIDRLPRVPAV
jgi:hypothetical protein